MSFLDLNLLGLFCHPLAAAKSKGWMRCTQGNWSSPNSWSFSRYEFSNASNATKAIDACALSLLGSGHGDGVCPTDFPRGRSATSETLPARHATNLYHAGIGIAVARSTLAQANETRISASGPTLAHAHPAATPCPRGLGHRAEANGYAFDTTTIELCLKLFPWARNPPAQERRRDAHPAGPPGQLPCFISMTSGSVHEVNILDQLPLEAGSYYMMDR